MKTMDEAFRIYKFIKRLSLWNAIELYILLCKIIGKQILQQIRLKKKSLSPQCNNMIKVGWYFNELGWQPKKLNLAACSALMTWRPVCYVLILTAEVSSQDAIILSPRDTQNVRRLHSIGFLRQNLHYQ